MAIATFFSYVLLFTYIMRNLKIGKKNWIGISHVVSSLAAYLSNVVYGNTNIKFLLNSQENIEQNM